MSPEASSPLAAHESLSVVTYAILIGAAALLVLGLQPILLGGLAEDGRLTSAGVGYAASAELFAFAIGASVGAFLMNNHMRLKAAGVAIALALVDLLIYVTHDPSAVVLERGVAGLLEGGLLGAPILVLTHHRHPERMNGFLVGFGSAPQILAAYLFPIFVIPRFGLNSAFAILAAAAALAAVACLGLVSRVNVAHGASAGRMVVTPRLVATLAGVFMQNAAAGATWNYLEQLAHQRGFSPTIVGIAVASSLTTQVLGALVAGAVASRFNARLIIIAGAILQAVLTAILARVGTPLPFVGLSCLFGLFLLSQQPYQVREIVALDPSRKAAMLISAVVMVGQALGPMGAAYVVTPHDVSGALFLACGFLVAAVVVFLLPSLRWSPRRSRPVGPETAVGQ